MALVRNVKLRLLTSRDGGAHRHRLRRRGPFVQQRRVGQRHLRQIRNHGLKVQQRFQTTLGDFRLVRRVLRVPTRILQDVSQNHLRHVRSVVAGTQIVLEDFVLTRHLLEHVQKLSLGIASVVFLGT